MASKRDIFGISGPLHLTAVDWKNAHHRRVVAASLVKGVYVLKRDQQQNRKGQEALAPLWWEFFHFQLHWPLINRESSIFGAIYEYKPMSGNKDSTPNAPRYVIAFQGTITLEFLKLDLYCILNELHRTFHFERAMQAVTIMLASGGDLNIWLAGHSLGSTMALLAGKNMAKSGIFLDTFLFNLPYFSAPIEKIKDKKVKDRIRIASSFVKAGLAVASESYQQRPRSEDPFVLLSPWVPRLFVNPGDYICAEYIGYFERRKKMEEAEEPLHLLPSAILTVNLSESANFRKAHGIEQWLKPDMHLHSKLYQS